MIVKSFIYPILDLNSCHRQQISLEDTLIFWNELALPYFQLRAKDISDSAYLDLAERCRLTVPDMAILANDRLALVLEHPDRFAGLHLGQEDLRSFGTEERERFIAFLQSEFLQSEFLPSESKPEREPFALGVSTHNIGQVQEALQGGVFDSSIPWSYIALGPMARTGSKPNGTDAVLESRDRKDILNYVQRHRHGVSTEATPLVFIGGLNAENIEKVLPPQELRDRAIVPVIALIEAAMHPEKLLAICALADAYKT